MQTECNRSLGADVGVVTAVVREVRLAARGT